MKILNYWSVWQGIKPPKFNLKTKLTMSTKDNLKNETHTFGNTLLFPVLGQTYNYFDDGKIKPSRRMEVVITEIIPFNKIDKDTLNEWKQEVKDCWWLYAKETDFFIKADLKVSDDKIEKIIFVRTINNSDGWFRLGWWAGRLDIDGSLNALLNEA